MATDYGGPSTPNSSTYSGKQFAVYVAEDLTVGAYNTAGADFHRIDVEGITLPTFTPNQEFEMRSSSGRIAEFDTMFSSSKGVETEFTLSGRLDLTTLSIFTQAVLGTAASSNKIELTSPYNPANIAFGDSVSTDAFHQTLSFYFYTPTADSDCYQMKGCVCTNLQLTADMGTASGRYDYSATFKTGYAPTKGDDDADNSGAAASSTNLFLSEQAFKELSIHNVDGASDDFTRIDPIFNSFSLTFDSPSVFLGSQGTAAEPQVIARAVPELNITIGGSLKYDAETDSLLEAHRDPQQTSYIQMYINNLAMTNPPSSGAAFADNLGFGTGASNLFGFYCHKAKLISASVGSGDVATLDFEAKVLDPKTSNMEILGLALGDLS